MKSRSGDWLGAEPDVTRVGAVREACPRGSEGRAPVESRSVTSEPEAKQPPCPHSRLIQIRRRANATSCSSRPRRSNSLINRRISSLVQPSECLSGGSGLAEAPCSADSTSLSTPAVLESPLLERPPRRFLKTV